MDKTRAEKRAKESEKLKMDMELGIELETGLRVGNGEEERKRDMLSDPEVSADPEL